MKARITSALVIITLFVAIIAFNSVFPLSLNIAISLISVLCVFELVKAMDMLKHWLFIYPSLAVSAVIPFMDSLLLDAFFIYIVYSFIMFVTLICHHKQITFKELATVYSMSVIIPSALLTIVYTRSLSENHGMFYAMIAILSAWAPDVGAYFSGTFWGKHKLCPDISPKKTIEGLIGGTIFSMIAMVIVGLFFSLVWYGGEKQVNYLTLVILGFIAAFTSVVGDLSFSLIKRNCGVKDFGQFIPGHGGFLDRFDSVIFTAPFVFFLINKMPIVIV